VNWPAIALGGLLSLVMVFAAAITVFRAWRCRRVGHAWQRTDDGFVCHRCKREFSQW
jgi:DMSO/TMAO reductase YedYZ heme-binding membrane subunit